MEGQKNTDQGHGRLVELETKIRQAGTRGTGVPLGAEAFKADRQGSQIAFEMIAFVLICIGIGWAVDRQFGSMPWGVLVGLFAGFVAGVANAWRVSMGIDRAVGWRKRGETNEPDHMSGASDKDLR